MQQNEDLPSEYHTSDYRNPTYDQHAKRLLAQRTIMARLLKRTVPEFKEATISDIAEKYIEGTVNCNSKSDSFPKFFKQQKQCG